MMNEAVEQMTDLARHWQEWTQQLPELLLRLVAAAVLAALGILAVHFGRRIIGRLFRKKNATAQSRTMHTLFLSLFNFVMYFIITVMALSALGVNVSSLLTVAGVGGVAIGFGSQTLIKDFISGLFIWLEGKIKVGDVVTVGSQTGTVEDMALRTTTLRGTNGNLYTIPNGDIRTVINMTRDYRNAIVDITISHGQDYTRAIEALKDAMKPLGEKLEMTEPPEVVGIIASDFRAATVRLECRCETGQAWALEREIRLAALECLKKEGIKP